MPGCHRKGLDKRQVSKFVQRILKFDMLNNIQNLSLLTTEVGILGHKGIGFWDKEVFFCLSGGRALFFMLVHFWIKLQDNEGLQECWRAAGLKVWRCCFGDFLVDVYFGWIFLVGALPTNEWLEKNKSTLSILWEQAVEKTASCHRSTKMLNLAVRLALFRMFFFWSLCSVLFLVKTIRNLFFQHVWPAGAGENGWYLAFAWITFVWQWFMFRLKWLILEGLVLWGGLFILCHWNYRSPLVCLDSGLKNHEKPVCLQLLVKEKVLSILISIEANSPTSTCTFLYVYPSHDVIPLPKKNMNNSQHKLIKQDHNATDVFFSLLGSFLIKFVWHTHTDWNSANHTP